MGKILCVEGPEGSGKSRLVQEVQRLWKGPSQAVHFSKHMSTTPYLIQQVFTSASLTPPDYLHIMDRCWLSDIVYRRFDGKEKQWAYENTGLLGQPPSAHDMDRVVESNGLLLLLVGSYYDPKQISKVGVTIQEEVDAYYNSASFRWKVMPQASAEEVIDVLAR